MSLNAPKCTGFLVAAALLAGACSLPRVSPHKAYAGLPRARDRVAVVLAQIEPSTPGVKKLSMRAIDGETVPERSAYALLPGPHSLELAGLVIAEGDFAITTNVVATLQVEVSAGDLVGLRAAPWQLTVEVVDLRQANLQRASATLEVAYPMQTD
jgi:hypothetical protein